MDELQNFFDNIKANADKNGRDGEAAVAKALKGLKVTLSKAAPVEEAPAAAPVPVEETPAPVAAPVPVEEAPAAAEVEAPAAESVDPAAAPAADADAAAAPAPAPAAEEVVDIPDNTETNDAARSLQNIKRAKDARAKVQAKRDELAALDKEEKTIEDEAVAAGVTDATTEAEIEEMASGERSGMISILKLENY